MSFSDLLDRPIAFHRAFVTVTGSVNAALFLSQALYWTNRSRTLDGWFYKVYPDWVDETGLTRREIDRCRSILGQLGILEEQRKGVPARIYYRVNKEALDRLLEGQPRPQIEDDNERAEDTIARWRGVILTQERVHLGRARSLGVEWEEVSFIDVIRQCGMRCGHCKGPIHNGPGNRPDDMMFEHKEPLVPGIGSHTISNVHIVHAGCKSRPDSQFGNDRQTGVAMIAKQDCSGSPDKSGEDRQTLYKETETTTETTKKNPPTPLERGPGRKAPGPQAALLEPEQAALIPVAPENDPEHEAAQVIEYLCQVTGRAIRPTPRALQIVKNRLRRGRYSFKDLQRIIDYRWAEVSGTRWARSAMAPGALFETGKIELYHVPAQQWEEDNRPKLDTYDFARKKPSVYTEPAEAERTNEIQQSLSRFRIEFTRQNGRPPTEEEVREHERTAIHKGIQ